MFLTESPGVFLRRFWHRSCQFNTEPRSRDPQWLLATLTQRGLFSGTRKRKQFQRYLLCGPSSEKERKTGLCTLTLRHTAPHSVWACKQIDQQKTEAGCFARFCDICNAKDICLANGRWLGKTVGIHQPFRLIGPLLIYRFVPTEYQCNHLS